MRRSRVQQVVLALVWVSGVGMAGWAWLHLSQSPVGGNGPGRSSAPAATALAEVHQRTDAAARSGYRWELVVDLVGDEAVSLHERGAVDPAAGRLWRAVTVVRDGEALPPMRMVAAGGRLFVQLGAVASAVGLGPGDWIGVPEGGTGSAASAASVVGLGPGGRIGVTESPAGPEPDVAGSSGPALPRLAEMVWGLVQDAQGQPEVVGRDEIGGVRTTHLRTSVRGAGLPAPEAPLAVDVWIDAERRVRRIEAQPSPDPATEGSSGSAPMVLRLDLFGYGQPVELDLPDPAAVVANDAELFGAVLAALRTEAVP